MTKRVTSEIPQLILPNEIKHDAIQNKLQLMWLNTLNCAIKWEHSCERWKVMTTCMTLKTVGDNGIHGLQVAHLCEADILSISGTFWRKSLHNAEDGNALNKCTHGGKPKCSAHMPPFTNVMMNKISGLSGKTLDEIIRSLCTIQRMK